MKSTENQEGFQQSEQSIDSTQFLKNKDTKMLKRKHDCRVNQRRYRERRRAQLENAEMIVKNQKTKNKIAEEFNILLRSRIVAQHCNRTTYKACFVSAYHDLFKMGLHQKNPSERDKQVSFLKARVNEDLNLGSLNGLQSLVEQWETYTNIYDSIEFRLLPDGIKINGENGDVIESHALLSAKINRRTLQYLCPDVITNEVLVQKLVGSILELQVKVVFYFDESAGVHRMDITTDYVNAVAKLVKDMEDILVITQACRMTEEGFLENSLAELNQIDDYSCRFNLVSEYNSEEQIDKKNSFAIPETGSTTCTKYKVDFLLA